MVKLSLQRFNIRTDRYRNRQSMIFPLGKIATESSVIE